MNTYASFFVHIPTLSASENQLSNFPSIVDIGSNRHSAQTWPTLPELASLCGPGALYT